MATDWIEVRIEGWQKFNGRKDVTHPSWFRVEYRMLEDPDFYDFSHEEFKAWLYVLAQACRKNSDLVRVNFEHAKATSKLSKSAILCAITKLESLQLVHADVTQPSRKRDVNDTRQDRTGQTGQTGQPPANGPSRLPPLAEVWNSKAGAGLSRVKEMGPSSKRRKECEARWSEHPDANYWTEVILRINESAFCLGANDRGWKADFDFLCRPDTHAKVLEGKYDGKQSGSAARAITQSEREAEVARAEIAEYERKRKAGEHYG